MPPVANVIVPPVTCMPLPVVVTLSLALNVGVFTCPVTLPFALTDLPCGLVMLFTAAVILESVGLPLFVKLLTEAIILANLGLPLLVSPETVAPISANIGLPLFARLDIVAPIPAKTPIPFPFATDITVAAIPARGLIFTSLIIDAIHPAIPLTFFCSEGILSSIPISSAFVGIRISPLLSAFQRSS